MKPRVLVAEPKDFSARARERLLSRCEVEERALRPDEYASALDAFDVLWIRLAQRIDRPLLHAARACRVLACATTGLDHIDLEACAERGIRVVSLRGETNFLTEIRATAELTIGITLSLLRRIHEAHGSVLAGEWNRDEFRGHEIHRKTVGIVGVGRLGRIVAEYFRAFGATVIGYDVREDFPAGITRCETLAELYSNSDIVSVHVTYSESTRNLVDPRCFRPGTWLVNTSRGGVLDEGALLEALDAGVLRGAALDVLTGEPRIDASHPVVARARSDQRLLLVPHIGGNTYESIDKTESFVAEKVLEALG